MWEEERRALLLACQNAQKRTLKNGYDPIIEGGRLPWPSPLMKPSNLIILLTPRPARNSNSRCNFHLVIIFDRSLYHCLRVLGRCQKQRNLRKLRSFVMENSKNSKSEFF